MARGVFLHVHDVVVDIDIDLLLRNRLLDGVLRVEDVVELLELLQVSMLTRIGSGYIQYGPWFQGPQSRKRRPGLRTNSRAQCMFSTGFSRVPQKYQTGSPKALSNAR